MAFISGRKGMIYVGSLSLEEWNTKKKNLNS